MTLSDPVVTLKALCDLWFLKTCPIIHLATHLQLRLAPYPPLVLLRLKFEAFRFDLKDRAQHGHRDSWRTMAVAIRWRRVAIELGMWRWILSGSTARSAIFGKARRLEVRGATRRRGGKASRSETRKP